MSSKIIKKIPMTETLKLTFEGAKICLKTAPLTLLALLFFIGIVQFYSNEITNYFNDSYNLHSFLALIPYEIIHSIFSALLAIFISRIVILNQPKIMESLKLKYFIPVFLYHFLIGGMLIHLDKFFVSSDSNQFILLFVSYSLLWIFISLKTITYCAANSFDGLQNKTLFQNFKITNEHFWRIFLLFIVILMIFIVVSLTFNFLDFSSNTSKIILEIINVLSELFLAVLSARIYLFLIPNEGQS